MRRFGEHSRRRNCLCVLGGVFLVALLAFSIGSPTATAVEGGEHGENVTVYRASNVTFESAEAIDAAVANETVEPADEVAVGDTLVVAIESERLAAAMNTSDGSNTTDDTTTNTTTRRFFTALSGGAEFRIVQTNPTTNANRKIALMGPENVTAHRDGTTVYAIVETGNLSFEYRRVERPTQIYGGERFAVQFGYDLPDDWSRGTVPDSPIVEFQPKSQLPTEQPRTTTPAQTKPETETSTVSSSETPTAEGSPTTGERANTTRVGERATETPGVPGFTVPTMLVALLVLAVRWTRRS